MPVSVASAAGGGGVAKAAASATGKAAPSGAAPGGGSPGKGAQPLLSAAELQAKKIGKQDGTTEGSLLHLASERGLLPAFKTLVWDLDVKHNQSGKVLQDKATATKAAALMALARAEAEDPSATSFSLDPLAWLDGAEAWPPRALAAALPAGASAAAPPPAPAAERFQGLSLAGFQRLAELLSKPEEKAGFIGTTENVKAHVKRATAALQCSYADLLSSENPSLVGDASVFVSHSYDYEFSSVLAAIAEWDSKNSPGQHFYYFDLLVNNQHGGSPKTDKELYANFVGGVASIQHTLLVLTWGSADAAPSGKTAPKHPLDRLWCVAEIASAVHYSTAHGGGSFSVAFDEPGVFERKCASATEFESILDWALKIDVHSAKATHADECHFKCWCKWEAPGRQCCVCHKGRLAECQGCCRCKPETCRGTKKAIMEKLTEQFKGSLASVNTAVAGALLESAILQARGVVKAAPSSLNAKNNLALLLGTADTEDRLQEARDLLLDVITRQAGAASGDERKWTLNALGNLGACLVKLGQLQAAEPYLLLPVNLIGRGRSNAKLQLADAVCNLATLYAARGLKMGVSDAPPYKCARALLEHAVEELEQKLKSGTLQAARVPECLATCYHNLGVVLERMGEPKTAEAWLRRALQVAESGGAGGGGGGGSGGGGGRAEAAAAAPAGPPSGAVPTAVRTASAVALCKLLEAQGRGAEASVLRSAHSLPAACAGGSAALPAHRFQELGLLFRTMRNDLKEGVASRGGASAGGSSDEPC